MRWLLDYLQLAIGGLFLETETYRQQRDAADSLQRGAMLVALIGIAVGLATLIGTTIEALVTPSREAIEQTVYQHLTGMPWYQNLSEAEPDFPAAFDEYFQVITPIVIQLTNGDPDILTGFASVFVLPMFYLLGWLVYGSLAHAIACMFGGQGGFGQTLGCFALAWSANLLNLVQIVPFAQVAGTLLLGLIASYIAIREAHELSPSRAFWAIVLVPLVVFVLFACVLSFSFIAFMDSLGNAA
ncbi:MAG: YIP1 family protein [Chloroflexaceae bacterium]|nr:YIP1 family protein [Chloroflexaceae bacterium]